MKVSFALLATAYGMQFPDEFASFKSKFAKTYQSEAEEAYRFATFNENLVRAQAYNADSSDTAEYGVTKFMDMSVTEFSKMYRNRGKSNVAARNLPKWNGECTACKLFPGLANATDDTDFDWTLRGAVTEVKDQGQCGSCWTFGTTGDVEGTSFLKNGKLVPLSEQQLVSCNVNQDDQGCNGGLQEVAFEYVIGTGLTTESAYPYTSEYGKQGKCINSKITAPLQKISSWVQVSDKASGEAGMKTALTLSGPITIGINAEHLQVYRKGIMDPSICRSGEYYLDHAVLITGYGVGRDGLEQDVEYWTIKNSWATDWGEKGYFRIKYGENKCGVAVDAVHSVQ
jgi:cathepsin F